MNTPRRTCFCVSMPYGEQEAMRDVTRAREDIKAIEAKARQRLGVFLLRHGRVYRAVKNCMAHLRWSARKIGKLGIVRRDYANYGVGARRAP